MKAQQLTLAKSELDAAIHAKCPKCRTGNMFANSMYGFKGQKMNETCAHCGFKFEVEPGYFYVAMFVSYALNVALLVTLGITLYTLTQSENPWLYIAVLFSFAFVLSPLNFRYSRVILLYWLTPNLHFDPKRAAADYKNPYLQ
jgi:uncharacterized protein (DUF983 family)